MADPFNILVLCTGNSARSLIAETLFRELGTHIPVAAFSAGSKPKGEPHPMALKVLAGCGHDVSGLSSKSWDVYGQADAPKMDLVVTICGNARDETCPVWPGHPLQVHWGVPDPAAITGEGQQAAFEIAYRSLRNRIEAFSQRDVKSIPSEDLRKLLSDIHSGSTGADGSGC